MVRDELIKIIQNKYNLVPIDLGELSKIDGKGMHFIIHCYDIPSVGRLAILTSTMFKGIMKMESIIITPIYVDAPLLSCDGVEVFNKYIALLEMYNTNINKIDLSKLESIKDKYSYLKDKKSKPAWHDYFKMTPTIRKIINKKDPVLLTLYKEYLNEYLSLLSKANKCDIKLKRNKVNDYVSGLFLNGGPAVNTMKKFIGEEKTKILFFKYLFPVNE